MGDDDLRPYFDAILAAPEDDAPRLELARVLVERGDQRGEHIRIQCELDKLDPEDPKRSELGARCKTLPQFWWFSRPAVIDKMPLQLGQRRGFIEQLDCSVANFVAHGELLMRHAPIRVYCPLAMRGEGAALAQSPALAKLRGLKIHSAHRDDVAAVAASPHLANLRELEVSVALDSAEDAERLAAAIRRLPGLRVLSMYYGRVDASALETLANVAVEMKLEVLDLRSLNMPANGIDMFRKLVGEHRVLPRPEPRVKYRFGVLDLGLLDEREVLALIDDGEYRGATKLELGGKRIGDKGIAHLARAGAFPQLRTLSLGGTRITDAGAYAIANDAVGFEHLEELWLGDVPAEGPEEKEIIGIKRDDGRVVESVIYHSIWP